MSLSPCPNPLYCEHLDKSLFILIKEKEDESTDIETYFEHIEGDQEEWSFDYGHFKKCEHIVPYGATQEECEAIENTCHCCEDIENYERENLEEITIHEHWHDPATMSPDYENFYKIALVLATRKKEGKTGFYILVMHEYFPSSYMFPANSPVFGKLFGDPSIIVERILNEEVSMSYMNEIWLEILNEEFVMDGNVSYSIPFAKCFRDLNIYTMIDYVKDSKKTGKPIFMRREGSFTTSDATYNFDTPYPRKIVTQANDFTYVQEELVGDPIRDIDHCLRYHLVRFRWNGQELLRWGIMFPDRHPLTIIEIENYSDFPAIVRSFLIEISPEQAEQIQTFQIRMNSIVSYEKDVIGKGFNFDDDIDDDDEDTEEDRIRKQNEREYFKYDEDEIEYN